jgi:hypothetical protein
MGKRFEITYTDPETEEMMTVYKSFEDWTGRAIIGGKEIGPVLSITAQDWANDYAYTLADKGYFKIREITR